MEDSSYSSEDEIRTGPLTVEEIRKGLQYKPKNIKYRSSDIGYYTYVPKEDVAPPKSDTSDGSAYFTPNTSIHPKFEAAPEKVCDQKADESAANSEEDCVPDEPAFSANKENLAFLDLLQQVVHGSCGIKLDNSMSSESLQANEVAGSTCRSSSQASTAPSEAAYEDSIIVISSDEEEASDNEHESKLNNEGDRSGVLEISDDVDDSYWEQPKIKTEDQTRSGVLDISDDLDDSNWEEAKIKTEDQTKSTDSNTSLHFNDTLEEMEMALKYGVDYMMPNDEDSSSDKNIKSESNKCNSPQKIKSPSIRYAYVVSPVATYIKRKSPKQEEFKLPLKPPATKATTTPKLTHRSKLKNIVSPVSIYIKNSPKVCLMKKVTANTVPDLKNNCKIEMRDQNKENCSSQIPFAIYKPANTKVANIQKNIHLPSTIQKLICEPTVIEHNKRINRNLNDEAVVEQKLQDGDLTEASISFHNTDISFITEKQGFIA